MRLVMDFNVDNVFVDSDATVLLKFSEKDNYKYSMFDAARDAFDEFFEHVVDAYEIEEVLDYYEYTKKSQAFQGSKNIP